MASSDPAYITNLKLFTRGALNSPKDLEAFESELYGENDRATAVLFGSLMERSLEELLRTTMRTEGSAAIFGSDGILGSFSSKIAMAYSLKQIGPVCRHDLNIIRQLRNEFAHSKKHLSFQTPVVKPVIEALQILRRKSEPDAPAAILLFDGDSYKVVQAKAGVKERFMVTCHNILHRMLAARDKLAIPFRGEPLP